MFLALIKVLNNKVPYKSIAYFSNNKITSNYHAKLKNG